MSPIPTFGAKVHDDGVQITENLAKIRVPVIAAVEGRLHAEYALASSCVRPLQLFWRVIPNSLRLNSLK